jgi:hypothetical protein
MSDGEIGIVNLVIELRRNGRAGDQGSHLSALPYIRAFINAVEGVCG